MEVARKILDLINKEPKSQPFTALQQHILNLFEHTNFKKFNKLLEGCELGDFKPTVLLKRNETVRQQLCKRRYPSKIIFRAIAFVFRGNFLNHWCFWSRQSCCRYWKIERIGSYIFQSSSVCGKNRPWFQYCCQPKY